MRLMRRMTSSICLCLFLVGQDLIIWARTKVGGTPPYTVIKLNVDATQARGKASMAVLQLVTWKLMWLVYSTTIMNANILQ